MNSGAMRDSTPKRIGKYRVMRKLGAGATSAVYLAEDAFLSREVAIKVADTNVLQDPTHGQRYKKLFLNEASLAGKLKHPHIASIHDAGVDDDCHYLVMEYVSGGTLERCCDAANLLPFSEVVEIVFKCCRALDYAYRQGVIHRDIKPANIMLGQHTDIKITDFGTALALKSDRTQVSGILGSPAYMSPEQVTEKPLTHQTDIYSLGVVMHQLLTGRVPFAADNQFTLLNKVINETPPPIRDFRSDVPPALEAIVERAMQKDTKNRYKTWNEFSLSLTNAFANLKQPDEKIGDTKKFDVLKGLEFFEDFTDVELWEVLRISSWKYFRSQRALIREGKAGQSFYILASGRAKVKKGKKVLHRLNAGDCFGEMAFIKQARTPRAASVVSETDVTLIKVRTNSLSEASGNLQLLFNKRFLNILVDRLAKTSDLVSQL